MANLKYLRNRIRSVNNTRQITKAMKMVSAAKLRRSQERALATRPYSTRIRAMIQSIAALIPSGNASPLLGSRMETGAAGHKKIHLVVYTADRGLCGSFNSTIIRAVRGRITMLQSQGHTVMLTFVGRKAYDVLKRQFGDLTRDVHTGLTRSLSFETTERLVAAKLLADFDLGHFDECHLIFNAFKSAMTQELTWRQLIPAPIEEQSEHGEESGSTPIFEPDDEAVLNSLLPRNIAVQVFQALAESNAAEHAARMTAMDNAVRNAGEMLKKLKIKYNRTRQAAITTELMEIIGGSESLKG